MATFLSLGGSQEVGRNCFSVEADDSIILLDMGFHLEQFLSLSEDEFPSSKNHSLRRFMSGGALPDIRILRNKRKQVEAIICSHAHLDHIAAIPFLIKKFRCPIYATPFTAKVIRSLCQEKHIDPDIVEILPGETFKLKNFDVEFIQIAHSTPQTVAVALHTSEGIILYANDYKEDNAPPFEDKTDISRLSEFSGRTKALIVDSLYSPSDDFCKSESYAREKVLDLKSDLSSHRAIFASTFSSHIHRLHSLVDLAHSLNREIVFVGRSLCRYIESAKDANIIDLSSQGMLLKYTRQVSSFFKKQFDPRKYFFIVTGHQGEPNAVLSRLADGLFNFSEDDAVIFSCNIIPVPISLKNRSILESKLIKNNLTIYRDIHVSGHAHAKDHRKLISLLKPEFVFPVHGTIRMQDAMVDLAKKEGVKNVFSLKVGESCHFE